ncbi:MAG TPA: hypothetical protein PKH69_09615 [Thiobacillaceae bacterium]|nr:hypothetical protein [Thiobacillaceae bacterium]HNU64309.1 hypothetical protein [Thiobacillaceae bacterium]
MRAEFPVEQLVRHTGHPFQQGFARQASGLIPASETYGLQPDPSGLLIQATDEETLTGPLAILRDVYGARLHLEPPRPRLLFLDGHWCEPVMVVRVRVRDRHLLSVRQDLLARGARLEEEDAQSDGVVLRARARLRDLLGYGRDFAVLTGSSGNHWIWLDSYLPVHDPPGGLAA